LLKSGFFKEVRELKIQRKNLGSALRFFKSLPSLFPMILDGYPPGITWIFLIRKPVTIFTPCDAPYEWAFLNFYPPSASSQGGSYSGKALPLRLYFT
jgi:hypothetical protein